MSHVPQLSRSSDSATHSRNTSRWIVPIPAIGAVATVVSLHRRVPDTLLLLGLAGLAGALLLLALAVLAREQTRRASLPYATEHILARAEARNRIRYAKAQTRRFWRIPRGETYRPDQATDLTRIIGGSNVYSAGDESVTRKSA
jgi:hypothetical protein